MGRLLRGVVAVTLVAGVGVAVARAATSSPAHRVATSAPDHRTVAPPPTSTTTSTTAPATTTSAAPRRAPFAAPPAAAPGPTTLAGCPPPPHAPQPTVPPWHPSVLVPDAALPPATPPAPWRSQLGALTGKGMWIWQIDHTEGGDAGAIVARSVRTGLHQLWVRVGDSADGFYGAASLAALVPRAHAAGIAVIGWGFPYLYDPAADATWSAQALAWRGPGGARLDGFSPDIEEATEGVALSERRAAVYLSQLRRAAGDRLIVATVYPPVARQAGVYPYATMATYVDAFAPMVYWECVDPAAAAAQALAALRPLRPVHVIGQGFDMAAEGGRAVAPSAAETARFLDTARTRGALGGSFWVWQEMDAEQWGALATFAW